MNIQLDTNIVIDLLEERKPYVHASAKFFNEAIKQKHHLCITANSVDNIAYVLRKKISPERLAKGLDDFFKLVDISPVNKSIILSALDSRWTDLEDAIQYYSALATKVDIIVSRDVAGYEERKIPVLTPADAFAAIEGS